MVEINRDNVVVVVEIHHLKAGASYETAKSDTFAQLFAGDDSCLFSGLPASSFPVRIAPHSPLKRCSLFRFLRTHCGSEYFKTRRELMSPVR